ncbi:phosphopantetheine-binding protein [Micromonospora matsumotoense]|uniref:acyl carrier protein n=1 Tax=Micromonospora matsumotoense TaxID=121616 RepID=UPI0034363C48
MTTTAKGTPRAETPGADDLTQSPQELIEGFLKQHTKISWQADQDIFAIGAVSSLFAMQLVVFLERTFGVSIGGADLRLDNFRTIATMLSLVDRLLGAPAGGDGE